MAILEVEHLEKRFGGTPVLQDVSFTLEQGQTLAILGSSGSGKTTLLRCLNALEQPDAGCIRVAGETLFDGGVRTAQRGGRLPFGLVFQAFHLFPQYTVRENVTLAGRLQAKRRPDYRANRREILQRIDDEATHLLGQVGLLAQQDRYPGQLSGGQQQRARQNGVASGEAGVAAERSLYKRALAYAGRAGQQQAALHRAASDMWCMCVSPVRWCELPPARIAAARRTRASSRRRRS